MNGENFLLLNTPFFKQRYSISVNFYLGCRIACEFCYYKMSQLTERYFRKDSELLRVGTAETLTRLLKEASLFGPAPITACASSDASMPENRKELQKFFELLDDRRFTVFLLHRPPWIQKEIDMFKEYENAVFSTTITPLAYEKRYNRIKDNSQIQGLIRIRKSGVERKRISVELGPVNEENLEASVRIASFLWKEGVIEYITIRGVSLGRYDHAGDITAERLIQKGFIPRERFEKLKRSYTYFDGKKNTPHEFYLVKNHIPEDLFRKFCESIPEGLKVHRITPTLYRDVFGYRISLSRNNRPRRELIERYGMKKPAEAEVRKVLDLTEKLTGMRGRAVLHEDHLFIEGVRATEDIAHRVGREIEFPVVFEDFSNQPTLDDLKTLPAYREILEISGVKI